MIKKIYGDCHLEYESEWRGEQVCKHMMIINVSDITSYWYTSQRVATFEDFVCTFARLCAFA